MRSLLRSLRHRSNHHAARGVDNRNLSSSGRLTPKVVSEIEGARLCVAAGASQVRRRLKGHAFGVRRVYTDGKNRAVMIHAATGDHLRQPEALFHDILSTPADSRRPPPPQPPNRRKEPQPVSDGYARFLRHIASCREKRQCTRRARRPRPRHHDQEECWQNRRAPSPFDCRHPGRFATGR